MRTTTSGRIAFGRRLRTRDDTGRPGPSALGPSFHLSLVCAAIATLAACGSPESGPAAGGADDVANVDTSTTDATATDSTAADTRKPPSDTSNPNDDTGPATDTVPVDSRDPVDVPLPDGADTVVAPVDPAPVAVVLGDEGGEVEHTSGATLAVPAGALPAGVELTLEVQAPPEAVEAVGEPVGPALVLGPSGQVFLVPVEIALPLDPDKIDGIDPAELQVVLSTEDGEFVGLETTYDAENQRLIALTTHFSIAVPVKRAGPPLTLTVPTLPVAEVGKEFGPVTLEATGGTPPHTFGLAGGSLPPGLALLGATLSGIPEQAGNFAPMLRVSDANGQKLDKAVKLEVVGPPNPEPVLTEIAPATLIEGSGPTSITATGSGYAYGALIMVNGKAIPTERLSETELRATLPAVLLAAPAQHLVAVVNPPKALGDGRSDELPLVVIALEVPDTDPGDVNTEADTVDTETPPTDTVITDDTTTPDAGDTSPSCTPTSPATEACDGVDNDCDGVTDLIPCSDGDPCTTGDLCTAGACKPGTALGCDDGNACTTDTCVTGAGCQTSPFIGSCSDGSGCTTGDSCVAGSCVGGTLKSCDDGEPCTTDTCDVATGACQNAIIPGCGGKCVTDGDCPDDGNACTTASCKLGECTAAPVAGSCDDGTLCTKDDACANGACTGALLSCDDGNPCTVDTCAAVTGCSNAPQGSGPCDDGDKCTTSDACASGLCLPGPALVCNDDNPCTTDACTAASGCTTAAPAGPCDDGDLCSTNDLCAAGACTGGPALDCDDGDDCTVDSCAAGCVNTAIAGCGVECTTDEECAAGDGPCIDASCVQNECVAAPKAGACSDGDACTTNDACDAGLCKGGSSAACDDGNACTDDTCDPLAGCTSVLSAAPCSDGNQCTTGDRCAGGACVPGAALVCDDGNACTVDLCAESSGCQNVPATGACDDGNPCTVGDQCDAGTCGAGGAKDCDDELACTTDQCDPLTGACVSTAIPTCDEPCKVDSDCDDGGNPCLRPVCLSGTCSVANESGTCDDGDLCTLLDTCSGGSCSGTPKACDDGNSCTDDACAGGQCTFTPASRSCVDGNACTVSDSCKNGLCSGGGALVCDDGNPCTDDACDPVTACITTQNTRACDDGEPCTIGDTCSGGACTQSSPKPCDDGDPCTVDSCDVASGACKATPVNGCGGYCGTPADCLDDGDVCTAWECTAGRCAVAFTALPCNDGDACTKTDRCDGGVCLGAPVSCDDGNVCTDDACDSDAGCSTTANTRTCSDGAVCTAGDVCQSGVCVPGAPVNCNDQNPCTFDRCDTALGCIHEAQGMACSDGDPCTTGDRCAAGSCVAGTEVVCDDGNACTADRCSPASGACISTTIAGCALSCVDDAGCPSTFNPCTELRCVDGFCAISPATTCDDGNACTTGDRCEGDQCRGSNGECDDGSSCTADACNPTTGCTHAPLSGQCSDGNVCTVNDTCASGACVAGLTQQCADGNPCTADGCDAASGCRFGPVTAPCDDGDACTAGDLCEGGQCRAGAELGCDDADACTSDACVDGACAHTPVPGCGAPCTTASDCSDDQNACTTAACTSGTCTLVPADATCDDGDACTRDDACDAGRCTGERVVCDDGNPCTDDLCDDETGCAHVPHSRSCAANDACAVDARCVAGACVGTSTAACDDGNACTLDGCDPTAGCVHVVTALPCDDGDACTREDECADGVCLGGTRVPCADGNACTLDRCDSATGTCVFPAIVGCGAACTTSAGCADDGNPCTTAVCVSGACVSVFVAAPCDDDDVCSVGDICVAGACTGTAAACDDGNACTVDSCTAAGGCTWAPRTGPCDDGSVCTSSDRCEQGVCVAGALASCDDGNPCTADACDARLGCKSTPNQAACSDGNDCTVGDRCALGSCTSGTPVDCDDGDDCTADTCNGAGTCTHTPVAGCGATCTVAADCGAAPVCFENRCVSGVCTVAYADAGCDDGDACTTGDVCTQGLCLGLARECDDDEGCTFDTCAPATGCVHLPSTGACADGSACTLGDQCVNGACVAGTPLACQDANPCTDDSCDPVTGCRQLPNTVVCNDGNACTTGDVCLTGYCIGADDTQCDDQNPCTFDGCSTATGCIHTPRPGSCSDGDACTAGDSCQAGSCTGGAAVSCDDGSVCTTDSCNPATGCVTTPADGPCDDGDSCSTDDLCVLGYCLGGTVRSCDDGDACTYDTCLPGDGCTHALLTGACDDGDACTVGETCATGACTGGTVVDCDDENLCTDDTCNAQLGCVYGLNKVACSDGEPCTAPDVCALGKCSAGPLVNCDDQNPCTSETCVLGEGCKITMLTVACDDGNACTTADTCGNGACAGTPAPKCDDQNPCTDDTCDPASGCVFSPNVIACDDGTVCTETDTCAGGACAGTAIDCDDGDACTTDTCDAAAGCRHTGSTGACDDGDVCTSGDTCSQTGCAGVAITCNDGKFCTTDACAPGVGCTYSPSGAPCDDGDACTTGDKCVGESCTAGSARQCDDGSPCTADSCVAASGCVFAPTVGTCNDDDACTTGDHCAAGNCIGDVVSCDDGKTCTTDSCDPETGCLNAVRTGACEDGNACTTADTCVDAFCVAGTQTSCDDENPCTLDGCSPTTGCTHTVSTAACDDGDLCTVSDSCGANGCTGAARVCDDGDDCTDDSCTPATGCVNSVNSVSACDDGDPCTASDACAGGVCSGAPAVCDDELACTTDVCIRGTGCVFTAEGALCNDNNPCTTDACDASTGCVNSPVTNGTVCTPLDDACPATPQCQSGQCVSTGAKPTWRTNLGKNFQGVPRQPTSIHPIGTGWLVGMGYPANDVSRMDSNGVELWRSPAAGLAVNGLRPTSDGNVIVVGGYRLALVNGSTGAVLWYKDFGGELRDVVETPEGYAIVKSSGASSILRVDKSGVQLGDHPILHSDGSGGPDMEHILFDEDQLIVAGRHPVSGGTAWAYSATLTGTRKFSRVAANFRFLNPVRLGGAIGLLSWRDPSVGSSTLALFDRETLSEFSGAGITLEQGNSLDLYTMTRKSDTSVIVAGARNPGTGWRNYIAEYNTNGQRLWSRTFTDVTGGRRVVTSGDKLGTIGSMASGGDLGLLITTDLNGNGGTAAPTCTTLSQCAGVTCNDNVACTVDTCNGATGCVYTPTASLCGDGNACTTDACHATNGCTATPVTCNDNNPCTSDSCDPTSGCVFTATPGACSDGDACTENDRCIQGDCAAGVAKTCNDGVACTVDTCSSSTGCVYTPSNAACDDGKLCTSNTCNATTGCVFAASTAACNDNNACTDDVCSETAGCSNPANVATCDDGNACTVADACSNKVCVGGAARVCDDLNPCTTDTCNSTIGCTTANVSNGTACPPKLTCATQASCSSGVCTDNMNSLSYWSRSVNGGSAGYPHNAFIALDGPDYDMIYVRPYGAFGYFDTQIIRLSKTGVTKWTADASRVKLDTIVRIGNELLLGGQNEDGSFVLQKRSLNDGSLLASRSHPTPAGANATVSDLMDVNGWHGALRVHVSGSGDDAYRFSVDYLLNITSMTAVKTGPGNDVITDLYWADGDVRWVGYTSQQTAGGTDGWINGMWIDRKVGGAGDDFITAASFGPGGMWGAGTTTIPGWRYPFVVKLDGSSPMIIADFPGSNHPLNAGLASDGQSLFITAGQGFAKLNGSGNVLWSSRVSTASPAHTKLLMAGSEALVGFAMDGNNLWLSRTDLGGLAGCSGTNVCASLAPGGCDDGIPCTADQCQVGVGCIHIPVDGACDDGNPCTSDQCSGTQGCLFPVNQQSVCNDSDVCTTDTCDVNSKKCVYTPSATACNDGNFCTTDVCTKGVGCSHTNASCDDGNPCTTDSCNSATGCVRVPRTGEACSDGSACTVFDRCGADPANPAQTVCLSKPVCDLPVTSGLILNVHASADGAFEKNAQNDVARWSTGTGALYNPDATLQPKLVPSALGPERAAVDFNDGFLYGDLPATGGATIFMVLDQPTDSQTEFLQWGGSSGITLSSSSGAFRLSGGNSPLGQVTRVAGVQLLVARVSSTVAELRIHHAGGSQASAAPPVAISSSSSYVKNGGRTDGYVNTFSNVRIGQLLVYNRVLDAVELSKMTERLKLQWSLGALCFQDTDCNDENVCTEDTCERDINMVPIGCKYTPLSNSDSSCQDGDACSLAHKCQGGQCVGRTFKVCDDGVACTVDACDRVTAACSAQPVADWTPCSDGNHCTVPDACFNGACGTQARVCDDKNPCTTDSCNPLTGCVFNNNTLPCDDLDGCTGPDMCAGGACSGPPNDAPCNDGDVCTLNDRCQNGACTLHAPIVCPDVDGNKCTLETCHWATGCKATGQPTCNDGNACTDDACVPSTGLCAYTPNHAACSDGSVCSVGDECYGGSCRGGVLLPCDDQNSCTTDSCHPTNGCVYVPTSVCNDGDVCTEGDFCVFGTCLGGSPIDCDDGNVCTIDFCDTKWGCQHLDEANGTACTDDDACTQGDACQAGACVIGPRICDYEVTSASDSGPGTLRDALESLAFSGKSQNTIKIFVDGLVRLQSPLPRIFRPVVIDATGRAFVIDGDGAHRVFETSKDLTLRGLRIQNTLASVGTGADDGFEDNRGGAVFMEWSAGFNEDHPTLVVEDCNFYNNFARFAGGAIHARRAGEVRIVRTTFSLNGRTEVEASAPAWWSYPHEQDHGGAVSIRGFGPASHQTTKATFDDVRFEYNMDPAMGAALWCGPYSSCTLTRSGFYGNKGYKGIFALDLYGAATLTNVSFISNEGWDVGGIIYSEGKLGLIHTTIAANNSIDAVKWPTLYVNGATTIVNSVIAENGPDKLTLACLKGPSATLSVTSSNIGPRLAASVNKNYGPHGVVGDCVTTVGPPAALGKPRYEASSRADLPVRNWVMLPTSGASTRDSADLPWCLGATGGMDLRGVPRPQGTGCDRGAGEVLLQ